MTTDEAPARGDEAATPQADQAATPQAARAAVHPEPDDGDAQDHPGGSLWRNRSYRLLLTGSTAEVVGAGIGAFAVPLVAYQITGSVVQAGLIAFVGQLGSVLVSIPAGVVVDRVDRRRLIMVVTFVAAMAWLTVVGAGLAGALTAPHLAAVLFVSSVAGALLDPADNASVHAVVRTEQLGQAMSVQQGREAAATLIAGPLGGLLFGMGTVLPFLVSAFGRLTSTVTASLVREPLNGDLASARAEHPLDGLKDGLRFVWAVPLFRMVLPVFVLVNINLNGMMSAVMLELVRTGTPPVQIGLLGTAVGIGVLAGSILAAPLIQRVRVGALTVLTLGMGGAATLVMAVLHSYGGYVGALAALMLFAPALNAGLISYLTAITPGSMQGRMAATLGLTGVVAGPLAPLVGSQLLEHAGIEVALWIASAVWAVLAVALLFIKPLWRIGLPSTWADDVIAWPR